MEVTKMSLRQEFVRAAVRGEVPLSLLCRQFGISRKTGYKWLRRFREEGEAALQDRSRRPHTSPNRTLMSAEQRVVQVRQEHPAWGGRKLHAFLQREGREPLPAASTMTGILRRYGLIDPVEALKHVPFQRFERQQPNELWQMDFKGHFPLPEGRCHPLSLVDDHSRFLIGLYACPDESRETVEAHLRQLFREYGLPEAMLMDNGAPWGQDGDHPYTRLTVWLVRLGIHVLHGRPYHPQTQGKEERLHRTLEEELLRRVSEDTLLAWQEQFDAWRWVYNYQRPHEALGMEVPASRYTPSPQAFPEKLPPIEYPREDRVRKVDVTGRISLHNRLFRIGKGFAGQPVAVRATLTDGEFEVYFCHHPIARIDLRSHHEA
jgi:transposase InsO family protein